MGVVKLTASKKAVQETYRKCKYCEVIKPIESFREYTTSSGNILRRKTCLRCTGVRNARQVQYRKEKKRLYTNRQRKADLVAKFGGVCVRCKGVFPTECYDFHHLDKTQKDISISKLISSSMWGKLDEELSKCVLLCANCHRSVHFSDTTEEYKKLGDLYGSS